MKRKMLPDRFGCFADVLPFIYNFVTTQTFFCDKSNAFRRYHGKRKGRGAVFGKNCNFFSVSDVLMSEENPAAGCGNEKEVSQ